MYVYCIVSLYREKLHFRMNYRKECTIFYTIVWFKKIHVRIFEIILKNIIGYMKIDDPYFPFLKTLIGLHISHFFLIKCNM